MLTEGVGEVGGTVSVLRGAPHPSAGLLWARWAISEEGQRVWAQGGETPAHPHVEPLDKVRPEAIYMLTSDDIKEFPKYEKMWKEIFQIRVRTRASSLVSAVCCAIPNSVIPTCL